ncbi:hypothetical protein [uncultured Alistipes sp.]|uniref:hypothetical protein n=1 Tax=uncultured Alistipes sp. TaxID=538949 RepID=UPI002804FCFE|nr:hypothetical protein [uncultured Alistipes sp.]
MARKIAELLIKLGADTLGIEKMSYDVRKQLNSLQKDLSSFGKSWSLYVTAPLTAAAGVAVKAADVQLKNEQRLLTALRGREDIQQRLIRQAGELQSRSLFGDEEIIGQQAFLASLGLTEQQINDTIEAAAQLSSATGMTLDSAVKNLAKTYGGLSGELGESIPKLKELTVEQMKNGEAVKFILDNYRGFAESAAETGLGPLQQLKNSIGDVGEEIGKVLMPMIQAAANVLKEFATWLQGLPSTAKTAIVVVGGLAAAVGPLSLGLGSIIKMLPAIKSGFVALTGPIGAITLLIGTATTAIIAFNESLKQASLERISARAKKYVNDGWSIDELNQLREEAEKKRLDAVNRYQTASAGLNPLKSQSLPYYLQTFTDNRREQYLAKIDMGVYDEKVKAIDEAITFLQSQPGAITIPEVVTPQTTSRIDEATGLIGELTAKISDLEDAKKKATSTSEIHNLTLEITSLRDELSKLQQIGSTESIAGEKGSNLFGKGVTPLAFDSNAINPPDEAWKTARQRFATNLSGFVSEAQSQVLNVMPAIRNLLSGIGTAIGEGLGDILSGDGTFEDLLGGIVKVMGQFLKSLGQQLIQLGVEMLQIKSALAASFSTPWAAIVAGVAAIAAGQAMISSFNKRNEGGVALAEGGLAYGPTMALVGDNRGAGSDPEVIAPLSKLRQYGLGRQTIEFVGGTFRLSGSDLVLAISREQAKINYVNARS